MDNWAPLYAWPLCCTKRHCLQQQPTKCTHCSNNLLVIFLLCVNRTVCSLYYLCKWDCVFLVLCFLSHSQTTNTCLIDMRGRNCLLVKQVSLPRLLYFLNCLLLLGMVSEGIWVLIPSLYLLCCWSFDGIGHIWVSLL